MSHSRSASAFRLFGRSGSSASYPFEEAYFLPYARQFRAALSMPLILLGGINRLETVRAGAWPRASTSWPWAGRCCASPTSSTAGRPGRRTESLCVHCNKCMPTIYRGTHCVLVE